MKVECFIFLAADTRRHSQTFCLADLAKQNHHIYSGKEQPKKINNSMPN